MNNYESLDDLYGYLRNRIYAMQTEFEPKRRLIPRRKVKTRAEQIALPRDRKSLQRELERIKDKMLFQVSSYQCYLADYNDIPNCIIEIGREREEELPDRKQRRTLRLQGALRHLERDCLRTRPDRRQERRDGQRRNLLRRPLGH